MKVKEFTKLIDKNIGRHNGELHEYLKTYYAAGRLVKLLEDRLEKVEKVEDGIFSLPISLSSEEARVKLDVDFGDTLLQMLTFCQFYFDDVGGLIIYFCKPYFPSSIRINLNTGITSVSPAVWDPTLS